MRASTHDRRQKKFHGLLGCARNVPLSSPYVVFASAGETDCAPAMMKESFLMSDALQYRVKPAEADSIPAADVTSDSRTPQDLQRSLNSLAENEAWLAVNADKIIAPAHREGTIS